MRFSTRKFLCLLPLLSIWFYFAIRGLWETNPLLTSEAANDYLVVISTILIVIYAALVRKL